MKLASDMIKEIILGISGNTRITQCCLDISDNVVGKDGGQVRKIEKIIRRII
jgi:hypothetical protein